MRISRTLLSGVIVMMLFAFYESGAQSGSIEESWNRAAREKRESYREHDAPAAPRTPAYPQWQRRQGEQASDAQGGQWKYQPPPGVKTELYSVNNALIDSLSVLFCIPSSYIKSLRNRNEAARGAAPPPVPDQEFQYHQQSPPRSSVAGAAMEQLNRELLRLLELCLTGG